MLSETDLSFLKPDVRHLYHVSEDMRDICYKYIFPVIVIAGLVGNTLTVVVLRRGGLGKSSAVVYLVILSVLDTAALIAGIVTTYLSAAWDVVLAGTALRCRIYYSAFPMFSNAAFWVLVAFTVDRYIAVCFPLRKAFLCRPRRAIAVCAILLVVSAGKQARIFWTYGMEIRWDFPTMSYIGYCDKLEHYEHLESDVLPYASMAIVFALPFAAILCANILIIRRLRQSSRLIQKTNADRKMTQTTIMCISISFAFFVCVAPTFAWIISLKYLHSIIMTKDEMIFRMIEYISNMFIILQHSVNFYLYCLTGQQFRADLKKALFGRCIRDAKKTGRGQQKVKGKPGAADRVRVNGKIAVIDEMATASTVVQ